MVESEKYKWPFIEVLLIIVTLMLLIAIGFTIGILSNDPDGLERTLRDAKGEGWFEGLPSVWTPLLGWIVNDYIAGIIGVLLSVVLIMAVFSLIIRLKKNKKIMNSDSEEIS